MMLEILSLEDDPFTAWKTAGALANTGATGVASDQKMVTQADGSVLFEVSPNQPYGDGFFYNRLLLSHPSFSAQLLAAKHFTMGMKIMVKGSDLPAMRAAEFEVQQTVGGRVYNFSLQGRPGKPWRSYDKVAQKWTDFPVPFSCNFPTDTFTHIFYDGVKTPTGLLIRQVNIDGVDCIKPGNELFHPVLVTDHKDSVNPAFQCDSQRGTYDSTGKWTAAPPSRCYVQNWNLKFE